MGKWTSFVADKGNWSLEKYGFEFSQSMLTLEKIRKENV